MEKQVTITGQMNTSINFAMQQNYVPVIRSLVVNNESEHALKNLSLKITFEPAFAREYTLALGELEAGKSVEISPVKLLLSTEFLFSLTEKMLGTILAELYEGEECIGRLERRIELLAYDEWSGLLTMPEIIAAFVTPNHPRIAAVLKQAAGYLGQWTKRPEFTGYQTQNPNSVKLQMAAVYAALQEERIVYNNPPASYEQLGQRVRLPHTVLEQKQGTCLDLAVLYASCLEAVGLHPLLVFKRGHAYGGCWLEEETFADCAVDDISALEKRTVEGAQELLLVECTDYVAGKDTDFERALKHGKYHLHDIGEFVCVIDVKRSRGSGIRPIPIRLDQACESLSGRFPGREERTGLVSAPKELDTSLRGKTAEDCAPVTRQKIWERKLLDFSLRNTLLNFRVTKNAIQLMAADLGELEDRLSDGKDFRVMEVPSEWTMSLRDAKMYEIETDRDLIEAIAETEFQSFRIRTFLNAEDLERNLKSLYRAAKVSQEENGSNTLFLALGFLRWFESDISERARYAPLVLVPVDLVKNNRNKGYIIRSRQEEVQINITLLEYLRQDYGIKITGLDPLPEDEHGIDLPLVFQTVRQAIMGKKRWNIENMAFLGLFSFGQFVMWNDIRNRAGDLKTNKVVSSLMEGRMLWKPGEQSVTADNLDEKVKPKDMAVPMSADSSQLAAIAAAAAGQSFVLHGPPGTGKSQTITNMIANALYQGKSVLFVAEKMAALNVVQKRLASIGLAPFCLELHSNKTNKTTVLGQLNQALEVGRVKAPAEYEAAAEKLYALRGELNQVIEAVHCQREYGCSVYEAVERFLSTRAEKDKVRFDRQFLSAAEKEPMEEWAELVRQYAVAAKEIGVYAENPWVGYEGRDYSIELRERLEQRIQKLSASCAEAKESLKSLIRWSSFSPQGGREAAICLAELCTLACNPASFLENLVRAADFVPVKLQLEQLCQTGEEYEALQAELLNTFETQVFTYPAGEALLHWKQAENSWFLPRLLGQSKLVKELKLYAKNPAEITKVNIKAFHEKLHLLSEKKARIENTPVELKHYMNDLFLGIQTDWKGLREGIEKAERIQKALSGFDLEEQKLLLEAVKSGADDKTEAQAKRLLSFREEVDEFKGTFHVNMNVQEQRTDWPEAVRELLERYGQNLSGLKAWTGFIQAGERLVGKRLGCVVDAYRAGRVDAENLADAYTCNLYYGLALRTISSDERLSGFRGKQYEDLIAKYREMIELFQKLTIQELVARLSAKVPVSGTESAASSEVGILKRAIKSNGRMLSIRKLFDQIPTLLRRLCPCMLMSPISVAQYIDPSFPKFDLVIFDEASQLPTSEAVGTIARGENVVVVGDPKQLPPTSFFSSNRVDEENSEKEDLESLLDDCLAISMPQEYLKWHYRSRHESLIAYSNMKYYDNKLYTFPSPNDLVSEVKLVPVEGFYDKGKTRQNRAEAEAVVAEIIRRLQDEKLRHDSIGVVTFSAVQQNLIDDLLSEEFAKHPELEEFDRQSREPVFIKNLENVQGDERDVILFSVGYGPDKDGKVSMNFGPLNREGGWRRLNVAISRARKSMVVYAVIRSEQIDLSRTRSEGIEGLKGFLEFAQRGQNVLAQKAGSRGRHMDAVVEEVALAIRQMGYEVKSNIGGSEYRLDLGIVNPQKPDTYVLGVLLDGENCREASTSRDRFVLQPDVLTGLGWKIMRVWMLEWLDNPRLVKKELEKAIQESIAEAEKEEPVPETVQPPEELKFEKLESSEQSQSAKLVYVSAVIGPQGTSGDFYEPSARGKIHRVTEQILKEEAPISRRLLMRKVLAAWNISRAGTRVESVFDDILSQIQKQTTKDGENTFYWLPSQSPKDYEGYRVEDAQGGRRNMDEIPSHEILNAIGEVLSEQISLSRTDLVRETAKKFGFSRLGNVIETTVNHAIDCGVQSERLTVLENGKVVLK